MRSYENLALVRGMDDTRAALRRWRAAPASVLVPWGIGSLLTALLLLAATGVVAYMSIPDLLFLDMPGVSREAELRDYGYVLFRNSLVLALHALACVAGFMAGSSLPVVAEGHSGLWRRIHDIAGPLAIAFVGCATVFSLSTQAYILGGDAANIAEALDISPAMLLTVLSLHAIPELVALFLPLAAWTIASRRGDWHELLAATAVTVLIAVPMLLISGAIEVWLTPQVLVAVSG